MANPATALPITRKISEKANAMTTAAITCSMADNIITFHRPSLSFSVPAMAAPTVAPPTNTLTMVSCHNTLRLKWSSINNIAPAMTEKLYPHRKLPSELVATIAMMYLDCRVLHSTRLLLAGLSLSDSVVSS